MLHGPLCLSPGYWDDRKLSSLPSFYMGAGDLNSGHRVVQQAHYSLSYLPSIIMKLVDFCLVGRRKDFISPRWRMKEREELVRSAPVSVCLCFSCVLPLSAP